MRHEYVELKGLGRLPADDALDESLATSFQAVISALPPPQNDEETLLLIAALPGDDSTAFGLAWGLLHNIEASPTWPIWAALDDSTWWVTLLRNRAARAGLTRPR